MYQAIHKGIASEEVMTSDINIDLSCALATLAKKSPAVGTAFKTRYKALDMVAEEVLATPIATYTNIPVQGVSEEVLDFGQFTLHAPELATIFSKLASVVAVVCTLGPTFEARISSLFEERKYSLALALDELGNELLFYTARLASLQIRKETRRQGLSAGNFLSPGDEGFSLAQQSTVVAMAGGENCGVSVMKLGMLSPVKSLSMVAGIGLGLSAHPLQRRCDTCASRERCRMQTC
jgi:hypothetical protein